ncbi:MAG: hypothetical protein STSR0008_03220 [Ignavibacterium sp.]
MNKRSKRRLLIFLIFPIIIAIPFLSNDIILRIIGIILSIIYVALIVFLRDSFNFKPEEKNYEENELEIKPKNPYSQPITDEDESFTIIDRRSNPDLITQDNIFKVGKDFKRTLIKPDDLKEKYEEIVNEALPEEIGYDGQFSFILEKLLSVIKESYQSYTTIFFWYNKRTEKLSIEKFISNSNDITIRKFDLEDDILSNIVKKGEPELLTEILSSAETDVIRYYVTPQGIKSFVGVPLFYDKMLIGILAMDSKIEDSFGIETIFNLGRYVRIITILISLFEKKYSEFISQKRLKGILSFLNAAQKFDNEDDLIFALEKSIANFVKWDTFTLILYNTFEKKFLIKKILNKTSLKYVGENLDIELNGTLAGKSIITGIPVKIDDTSSAEYKRFSKIEDITFDGSFLAVPLIYQNQIYGLFCFESLKKNAYSKEDAMFLLDATKIFSFMLHTFASMELLKNLITLDIETKLLNHKSFIERLKIDLVRADHLKIPSAIALIRIDDFLEQETLFDGNPFPTILSNVSEMIMNESNPFNIIGRLDERIFAVYFFNATSKDVYIWAEKFRIKIARLNVPVLSKQTSFTISIGVAASNGKTEPDEFIYNAKLALQKAIESGGNKVTNIN